MPHKQCEDCGLKRPTYGAPGTKRTRWCAGCARSGRHPQAVDVNNPKCEDCGLKRPSFGAPGTKRARWCGGCARSGHPQAVNVKHPMCEDCGLKQPTYAVRGTTRRRWCGGCARSGHPQAVDVKNLMCEDCGLKVPSYGAPGTKRKRWCGGCARSGHPQAVDVRSQMCEDCGLTVPSYGAPGTKRKRWCAGCARSGHPQAVDVKHPSSPPAPIKKKNIRSTKTGRQRSPIASPEPGKTAKEEARFISEGESAEDDVVVQELAEESGDCVQQPLPQDGDVVYINWEGEGEYLCKVVADEDGLLGAEPLDGSWSDPDLEFEPDMDDWHWPSVDEDDDRTLAAVSSSVINSKEAHFQDLLPTAAAGKIQTVETSPAALKKMKLQYLMTSSRLPSGWL